MWLFWASLIVGKPVGLLLLQEDCPAMPRSLTAIPEHPTWQNIRCRQISSLQRLENHTSSIKYGQGGAIVIDVGINRIPDATRKSGTRLVGDVNFEEVSPLSSFITPVPEGWTNDRCYAYEKYGQSLRKSIAMATDQ